MDERQDWNMIAADCFVLSCCCCQCLILQILVFLLLKLPTRLFRKTKQYMKRKFGIRRKVARCAAAVIGGQRPQAPRRRVMVEDLRWDGCMEEVEKVLEEMCEKGEFGFGSFWRGDDIHHELVDDDIRICFVNQQLGYHDHDGNYHFIQVFGPLTMHSI
ncbi:hypothetical protein L6452_13499 [Arctium lappa]|uniref:Uncharacterized protein n=1 Tax=Arctium lappa TaxID=4217 RepID=A0ACB9CIB4_ARCLA|nr:hypothetical protein L6452_13499 [Arctium lappa]